jgi:hypothetical protein
MQSATTPSDRSSLAIVSLVLGVISLCAWFLPICGIPISAIGAILGGLSMGSSRRGMAIAGLVLCVVGLLLGLCNAAFGAYFGLQGGFQNLINPQ